MSTNPNNLKNPNQYQKKRFEEAARALECDESEERFDETLKKVAKHESRKTPTIKHEQEFGRPKNSK